MSAGEDRSGPPAHGTADAETQVPLPRRAEQAHLAPQLRSVGAAPAGTAFTPFEEPAAERREEAAAAPPAQRTATTAADVVAARRRARAGAGPDRPAADR